MHASESLRIFVVRGQIAQSAQPFSKGYSIEERPVQRRSAPAIPQHGAYGDLSSAARKTFINVMRGGKLPAREKQSSRVQSREPKVEGPEPKA